MSKDFSYGGVVKPLDIPAVAGPVHHNPEGTINADNAAGGEVRREKYAAPKPRE